METSLQELAFTGYYLRKYNSQLSCLFKITFPFLATIFWT